MHFHNKLVGTLLAGCMMASVLSIGASAAEATPTTTSPVASTTSVDVIKPQHVTPSTAVFLNPGSGTQLVSWPVYSGYGYWKIFVSNTSASATKVTITKGSPTGRQVGDTMIIPAGQRISFYCDENSPLATGAYYLSISTDGTYNLSGMLYYKFANTYSDLL